MKLELEILELEARIAPQKGSENSDNTAFNGAITTQIGVDTCGFNDEGRISSSCPNFAIPGAPCEGAEC